MSCSNTNPVAVLFQYALKAENGYLSKECSLKCIVLVQFLFEIWGAAMKDSNRDICGPENDTGSSLQCSMLDQPLAYNLCCNYATTCGACIADNMRSQTYSYIFIANHEVLESLAGLNQCFIRMKLSNNIPRAIPNADFQQPTSGRNLACR